MTGLLHLGHHMLVHALQVATPLPAPSAVPIPTPEPTAAGGSPSGAVQGLNLPTIVLTIFVWSTLLGAFVVAFMPERNHEDSDRIRFTALGASAVAFLIGFMITVGQIGAADPTSAGVPDSSVVGLSESHRWLSGFPLVANYHLDIDGVALPLLMLSCSVFIAVLMRAWRRDGDVRRHVTLVLVAQTGASGVLCARDLVMIIGFWGMLIVATTLLMRIPEAPHQGRATPASRFAAINLLWLGVFALGGLLAATHAVIPLLASSSSTPPTFDTAAIGQTLTGSPASTAGFFLMFTALLAMMGGFPFHRWAIEASSTPDVATNAIIGGVVTRLAGFVMLHHMIASFPEAASHYSALIATAAVASVLWGAASAWVADSLRRLPAHVGLVQTGAFLLGASGLNRTSLVAAVVVLVVGGLSVTLLTLLGDTVEHRTRHASTHRLGGLAAQMPRTAAIWIVVGLSVAGVPLLAGFNAELLLATGAYAAHRVATVVVLAAILLTGGAVLRLTQRIFMGPPREVFSRVRDASALDHALITPLLVLVVMWGVMPGRVLGIIANGVQTILTSRLVSP